MANRYGVYNTPFTIRKFKVVMRRMQEESKRYAITTPPDFVLIKYSDGKYIVRSDYYNLKKSKLLRSTVQEFDDLSDFEFVGEFTDGTVILDLMGHEQGNLYVFDMAIFKGENKIRSEDFTLGFLGNGEFELTIYRKEGK